MRHFILRFFLIFACVAMPLYSHACWDDSYDDYYDYDDYDWDENDWDDDGSIWLDEVVVTPDEDYDWGLDDDWWRTDNDDEDDYSSDDDWYDDEDVSIGGYHPDNNKTTSTTTPPLLPNEVHKPESNEVLFAKDLPARYPYQTCHFNCFTTTLAICNALVMGDFKFEYYNGYLSYIENTFLDLFNRNICNEGIYPYELYSLLTYGCNIEYNYITVNQIAFCIDDGDIVMATIANGTHEVAIVGYYDEWGGDAYQCVNPGNGMYETHYADEFKGGSIIRYSKTN